jgi:hypothetical protein
MSTKSVSFKVILGLTTACGALAAVYLWLADPLNLKSLSDQELISIFSAHPAAFEQLRQMATEDMQRESYFSESNLDSTLDTKRKQTYKSLLSEIYPRLVVTIDHGKIVRFIFASGGLSAIGPGWLKGIEYLPENYKVEGVRQNLDAESELPAGSLSKKY